MDESKPSLDTLTAFDIVEPTMIPKLYEIFLIALQEDLVKQHEQNFVNVLEGNDNAEVRYLALSVPCISDFGGEDEQYHITVRRKEQYIMIHAKINIVFEHILIYPFRHLVFIDE